MKKKTVILDENTVQAQKEFIVNEFCINLIDSEERDDRIAFQYNGKSTDGYRYLAMLNWPKLFEENPNLEVHHINGDHFDNRLCNLVPVTRKQHRKLHARFFDDYKNALKIFTESGNRVKKGKHSGFYGHNHTNKTRSQISESLKEYYRKKKEGLI